MREWTKIQKLPTNTEMVPRNDMPNEEWVLRKEADEQIAELASRLAAVEKYVPWEWLEHVNYKLGRDVFADEFKVEDV